MKISPIINNKIYSFKSSISQTKNSEIISKSSLKQDVLNENNVVKPTPVLRREIIQGRQALLAPITNQSEYKELLSEIMSYKDIVGINMLRPPYISQWGYEKVDENLKGLISYCGYDDKSDMINSWLTARPLSEVVPVNDIQISKIIRTMDYSLKKLDDKYGKYKGVVYRSGFFNPITDKQYYSTSADPINAARHVSYEAPSIKTPYSIIKVKNGHNIDKFQKEAHSFIAKKFSETEKEVLIDRKSKFRIVPETEYTDTDKRLKSVLLAQIVNKTDELKAKDIEQALKKHSNLLQYISIWEEI